MYDYKQLFLGRTAPYALRKSLNLVVESFSKSRLLSANLKD